MLGGFCVREFNYGAKSTPMTRITDGGIWEARISIKNFRDGMLYKYKLKTVQGDLYSGPVCIPL